MVSAGQQIELAIEKPAAGGRMIARHEGQVVLVAGALPGERVLARIDRAERRLAFASVVDVREISPDRREPAADPLCGGCVYSHISYPRQTALKAEIVRDAFLRIGRIPLPGEVPIAPSLERDYRMRARFHVHEGRFGFYREGTHVLCDAASTGQMTAAALQGVHHAVATVESAEAGPVSIELTENINGDRRALAIDVEIAGGITPAVLEQIIENDLVTGCVVRDRHGRRLVAGQPLVSDPIAVLTGGAAERGDVVRGPESFFQANRYLVPGLVTAVMGAVRPSGDVLDLYAGVGLFSIALAAAGRTGITAVEGDRASGSDLRRNAAAFDDAVALELDSVEAALHRSRPPLQTVIVDPPRTGISAEALTSLAALRATRIIYVSCDPATLARDARKLLDAGYLLDALQAFDLFPNTPHVECLGVFSMHE
jgi:23S rRNA (uracil1939-C5)-methyltransferase